MKSSETEKVFSNGVIWYPSSSFINILFDPFHKLLGKQWNYNSILWIRIQESSVVLLTCIIPLFYDYYLRFIKQVCIRTLEVKNFKGIILLTFTEPLWER
jgi:hypothetical protein